MGLKEPHNENTCDAIKHLTEGRFNPFAHDLLIFYRKR